MKVKTLIEVNGQNLYNEVAVLEMLSIQPLEDGSIKISAEYQKEDGTPVKSVPKTYTAKQVDALYEIFKSSVTKKNPVTFLFECMGKAMAIEVATTFGVKPNDIEIIND